MKLFVVLCILTMASAIEVRRRHLRSPVQICEPNTAFMDDCNKCWCTNDGFDKTCTKINCLESSAEEVDNECTPGEGFHDACNYCICPKSGSKKEASCTKVKCP